MKFFSFVCGYLFAVSTVVYLQLKIEEEKKGGVVFE